MDDKVPLYVVNPDSSIIQGLRTGTNTDDDTTTPLLDGEESGRPSLVIDNLRDPSALLDPETEAAIRTKGILIGSASIGDRKLPLYLMHQEENDTDEVAAETKSEDEMPALIPIKKDEDDLISLSPDSKNNPEGQETSLDSFEERILEALGGFEMATIRKAYIEASELHANTIGALPNEDYLFIGRIGRAAKYCGNVLKSFRRQVLRGIDHGMVNTMLLYLKIVINVLGQIFPAHRGKVEGTIAQPSTSTTDNEREGALTQNTDAEYHGVGVSDVHDKKGQRELSGENVEADTEKSVTHEDLDGWSWEDIVEAHDFTEIIGWEML